MNQEGYREILGIVEGTKEDKAGWSGFLKHLKVRGLSVVKLFISNACLGLAESAAELYPEARRQWCVVHFYRNVFSHVPATKLPEVALMLKAIHAQENRAAVAHKAAEVIAELKTMRLPKAAELVENRIEETFSFYAFPDQHWIKLKANNPLERLRALTRPHCGYGPARCGRSGDKPGSWARSPTSNRPSTWPRPGGGTSPEPNGP